MTTIRVFALAAAGIAFSLADGRAAEPTDPADLQLNAKGRAILAYFQRLQAQPELKLVSGQFNGWSGTTSLEEMTKIHETTGRWPAILGLDYCTWVNGEAAIGCEPPNQLAKAWWRHGGLVTISWHAPNPANPQGGGLRDKGVDLRDLLAEGSAAHRRWLQALDTVAAGLSELQDAGVVVIWRPWHEMNGGWFWWGAKAPADFVAVWRHMHDYFTRVKNLHNLIWAFGPNKGANAASYYPGDAFVDLTGIDAYTDDVDADHIQGFRELAGINKPVGLTEYGPHGASNPPGDFDYRRLLDGLARNFPQARHFLCWNQKWNPAENKFAREFYNDPRIITRDDLPAGLTGAPATVAGDYVQGIETWRAGRIQRLTKPDGWLSLIGRHPLEPGTWTVGSAPDNAIRLAAGPAHFGTITYAADGSVTFAVAEALEATIDGTTRRCAPLDYQSAPPTTVRAGPVSFHVMEVAGKLFLRVRDSESARRKNFAGIEHYPVDPRWRIEAAWVPFDPPHEIRLTNVAGLTETEQVPGMAVFTHEGRTYELRPINEAGEERLFFILTDATAGTETYEASRFFYADRPKDGKVILDFNQVYNPPCAFSPFTTCLFPPKENVLPFPLRAGEKKYQGAH